MHLCKKTRRHKRQRVQKCHQNAPKKIKNEEAQKHTQERKGRDEMHTKGLEMQECENMHKKKKGA